MISIGLCSNTSLYGKAKLPFHSLKWEYELPKTNKYCEDMIKTAKMLLSLFSDIFNMSTLIFQGAK